MTLPCGCCEGIRQMTPATITNPANASALSYRVGTHASFFESMVARLSAQELVIKELPPKRDTTLRPSPLLGLTTRAIDDPAIALLDAWAIVADVLTFYQERIANEGYLPTATERRSIMELAALVGYMLRPGVAASGYLAFLLQDGYDAEIPPGTRAQTLPGPGEMPESFEIGSSLAARAGWNNLRPRQTRPLLITPNWDAPIYLAGTATNLKPNDPLLLDFGAGTDPRQEFRRVKSVIPEPAFSRTKVEFQPSAASHKLAAVSSEARTLIDRHLDPRSGVFATKAGGEVIDILQRAAERRATSVTHEQVTDWMRDTLARLRGRHRNARGLKYRKLEESIGGIIGELEALLRRLPPPGPPPTKADGGAAAPAPASFEALMSALSKPPSNPPMSASELAPTLAEVFAAGSDRQLEFLAALRPTRVSPYRALANAAVTAANPVKIYALRTTAHLFGHAAPKRLIVDTGVYVEWPVIEYPKDTSRITGAAGERILHEHPDVIDLDGSHPEVLESSWIVVSTRKTPLTRDATLIAHVARVATLSRADYGISGDITRIDLDSGSWIQPDEDVSEDESTESERGGSEVELDEQDDFNAIRSTVVYAHSELLAQAEGPVLTADGVPADIEGGTIELGHLYEGLQPGRWLIVTGNRTDIPSTTLPDGERVMLQSVEQKFDATLPGDRMHSTLTLANPLAFTYERGSVAVYGNVAAATNGETRREVLGSGDGSRASQEFTLRHPFLTYIPARNERGMASTLQVLVDDIPWTQVETLAMAGPKDHVFTTRTSNEDKTAVIFGDGRHGARLPSGSENVVAVYRTGSGAAFDAPPGKVSLLATKPLGVKSVVNPLVVEPGSGPEPRDSGRRNAPLGVAPLDRLVSVPDYEQFSLGFGGVGKATASELWDGSHEVVHVTVAGMDSGPLPATSGMLDSLEAALQLSGDPSQPVLVAPREFLFLVIRANVTLAGGFSWDVVSEAIRQRLLDHFGFEARGFAQDVVSSDVISAIQAVAGVESVRLLVLDAIPETITAAQLTGLGAQLQLRQRIHARLARLAPARDRILPAQLCVLNPKLDGTLTLELNA